MSPIREFKEYYRKLKKEVKLENCLSCLQIIIKIPCRLELPDFSASSATIDGLLHKDIKPDMPVKNELEKLRLCFSIDVEENQLYLDLLYVPLKKLQRCLQKIEVGDHIFYPSEIDEEGSVCAGNVKGFTRQDIQNTWLEINFGEIIE